MIKDIILSLFATIGFAILFEVKLNNIFFAGICGSIGWVVYVASGLYFGIFISTLLSSLSIIILARVFAKLRKAPAMLFYIPGIFPIVPGAGIYNTAYAIVNNNFSDAQRYGLITIKTSCAIVLGIAIVSIIPYSYHRKQKKLEIQNQ